MLHIHRKTSVSTLLGASIHDAEGRLFGRVQEFAVAPITDANHVHSLLVRRHDARRSDKLAQVPVHDLQLGPGDSLQLQTSHQPALLAADDDSFLLLDRDLLDQQIIDVDGHKVVRVNDVDLTWLASRENPQVLSLRICEVEVGPRGAIRRLLKGLSHATINLVADRLKPDVIPWEFVDLIDRDPARRVKLKIEQDRLSRLHPSDIAKILEDLAPAKRQALFISLDEETAAEALEEINPKMQEALLASLDSERVAGIVEEMDPGAAADLLSELSDERSDAILEEMDPEERQEVEDLLEFSGDSAAGLMTTDYIALGLKASVSEATTALREFEGDPENVAEIYILDAHDKLAGLVSVVQLLLAHPEGAVSSLPQRHIVSCHVDTPGRKVAEIFDKYNLRSLPVLDHEDRLAGIIHAEQVIALLRK